MKLFEKFKNIVRLMFIWWAPISLRLGSRRLEKWLRKNKREQDPSLYNLEERWKYIRKKNKLFLRRMGIKVQLIGEENIPKTGAWITPNHTSNFDSFALVVALGGKSVLIPTAKYNLQENKLIKGYINGADGFYIKRSNIRDTVLVLNQAANFAKQNNRAIILFPEGTRSLTTELLEFKPGSFKFPQKYAIPIVPVTILGTLQAKQWWKLHYRYIKIIIGKPIKPIEHMKIPTNILARRVQDRIALEVNNYQKSLSPRQKAEFVKLQEKARKSEVKKNLKKTKEFETEESNERSGNNK